MSQRQNPQTLLQLRIELRYTDPLIWRRVLVPDTITLAHLHAVGVQFSNFHTSVSCSPSRAMLMTGTDNHIAGLGNMCDCDFNQDDFCGGPDFTLFNGGFNGPSGTSSGL